MRELSHRCILVVDDDSIVRSILSQSILSMGYEVLTSENGAKALETLKSVRVDAILCDIEMPEMDGIQFCESMKQLNLDTPVVIVTGLEDRNRILDALRLGALDFIHKPFQPDDLKPVIERAAEIGVRRNYLHALHAQGDLLEANQQKKMIDLLTLANQRKRAV